MTNFSSQKEKKSLELLRRISLSPKNGNDTNVASQILSAWRACPNSEDVLMAATLLLCQLHHQDLAMDLLQEALVLHGETITLLSLMGKVSTNMEIFDTGEKVYKRLLQYTPHDSDVYVRLSDCLRKQDKHEEALELTKQAVTNFPENADLWNQLGILTQFVLDDMASAKIFFKQALGIKQDAGYLHNLSGSVTHPPAIEKFLKKALSLEPKNSQINLTYALFLFTQGHIEKGWKHYKFRKDATLGSSKACHFSHNIPNWSGQNLKDKSIVVCAEQGIGDEFFFMLSLPSLVEKAKQVYVVCDPRIQAIVERSFPGVIAFPFEDEIRYGIRHRYFPELEQHLTRTSQSIDYFALIGDVMGHFHNTETKYQSLQTPYLSACPKLSENFRKKIDTAKLNIGFAWRSGNLSNERSRLYLNLHLFIDIAKRTDANFYVLQYAVNEQERELLNGCDNIHQFDDIDLKENIEANLAIISQLDLVMAPPVATQSFAVSIGTPVWLMNRGAPWTFMGKNKLPNFYSQGSRWWCTYDYRKNEDELLEEIVAELSSFSR